MQGCRVTGIFTSADKIVTKLTVLKHFSGALTAATLLEFLLCLSGHYSPLMNFYEWMWLLKVWRYSDEPPGGRCFTKQRITLTTSFSSLNHSITSDGTASYSRCSPWIILPTSTTWIITNGMMQKVMQDPISVIQFEGFFLMSETFFHFYVPRKLCINSLQGRRALCFNCSCWSSQIFSGL